mgnify:CR=1 FL=1
MRTARTLGASRCIGTGRERTLGRDVPWLSLMDVKTLVRHSPCFVVCFPKATKRLDFSVLRTCHFFLRTYTKLLVTRDTFRDSSCIDSIVIDFDPNNNRLALLQKLQIYCVISVSIDLIHKFCLLCKVENKKACIAKNNGRAHKY